MTRFEYYVKRDGNLKNAYKDYKTNKSNMFIDMENYNNWLVEEYVEKPKPILDKIEHKYLKNFLRPFKDKVKSIEKCVFNCYPNKATLLIEIENEDDIFLPYFNKNDMYVGMKPDHRYTYETLIENNHE